MSNERRESSEINQAVERQIARAQRLEELPGVVETAGHELVEVMLERIAQHRKWGEQNHPNAADLETVRTFTGSRASPDADAAPGLFRRQTRPSRRGRRVRRSIAGPAL